MGRSSELKVRVAGTKPIVTTPEVEMFGDPNLDIRINAAERKADRARQEIDRTEGDVNALRKKVSDLSVVCRALMELLQEHTPCTAEQIQIKVRQLEELAASESKCTQCGRMKSKRSNNCPYCGVTSNTTT